MFSREAAMIAFASAWTERHISYLSPRWIPSFVLMQFPISLQLALPRGAPLYPVEMIVSFFTIIAPNLLRRQVERSDTVSAISR